MKRVAHDMKVLAVSGTLFGRKTRAVLEQVLAEISQIDSKIKSELLDLKEYEIQFCDGRATRDYTGDTKKLIDKMCAADCYVLGTPILHCSFTGVLKNLLELVPPTAFKNKVMGFVANGNSDQHYMVVENQLKPIASYLRAYSPSRYVYVHRYQFGHNNEIIDPLVNDEIRHLAQELVLMLRALIENRKFFQRH